MSKAKEVIIKTQNSVKLGDYFMLELRQNVNAGKLLYSVQLLSQCEQLIY